MADTFAHSPFAEYPLQAAFDAGLPTIGADATLRVRILKINIGSELRRVNPSAFLRLPREIRFLCYEYAFADPPLWARRHQTFCPFQDRQGCSEPPPFFDNFSLRACRCAKRASLNLLLANRQISLEATPFFWGHVELYFPRIELCIVNLRMLRPKIKSLIKHIRIFTLTAAWYWQNNSPGAVIMRRRRYDELWAELSVNFNNLQSLHLASSDFTTDSSFYPLYTQIQSTLPQFRSLQCSSLLGYDLAPPQNDLYGEVSRHKPEMLYPLVERPIPLGLDKSQFFSWCRDLHTNFHLHLDHAIKLNLLGQVQPSNWRQPLEYPLEGKGIIRLPEGVASETQNKVRLLLRDGSSTEVELLGLGNGKVARLRIANETAKVERNCRMIRVRYPQEQQAKAVASAARHRRAVQKQDNNQYEINLKKSERKKTQESYWNTKKMDEKKREEKKNAKIRRKARAQEKVKQVERKRVPEGRR